MVDDMYFSVFWLGAVFTCLRNYFDRILTKKRNDRFQNCKKYCFQKKKRSFLTIIFNRFCLKTMVLSLRFDFLFQKIKINFFSKNKDMLVFKIKNACFLLVFKRFHSLVLVITVHCTQCTSVELYNWLPLNIIWIIYLGE